MSIIGFDFGTTNSLVSLAVGDRVIRYLESDDLPTPSVVCYQGSKIICGRDAKRMLTDAGLGVQGNIVRSPKMFLGRETIHVDGMDLNPIDVTSHLIKHVLRTAAEGTAVGRRLHLDLSSVRGAIVTIPVGMYGAARRALRDACGSAELPIIQFIHEPLAALYAWFRSQGIDHLGRRYENKLILVVDWGGGTLDLTLCRLLSGNLVQLLNDGTNEVGGDHFDEAIRNHVLTQVYLQRRIDSSAEVRPGARARLLDLCERAKIRLSTTASFHIYIPDYFVDMSDNDFVYELSRDEFESLTAPLQEKAFLRLESLLDKAGYSIREVSLCLVTGGMSSIPSVKSRLNQMFGPQRLMIPDNAASLIAEGAAWIGCDDVALKLAKDVEILLARHEYVPILRSGTTLPTRGMVLKGQQDLFCTDPSYGRACIQVYSPYRSGRNVGPNERRIYLGGLSVQIDSKAGVFRERLNLGVEVDQNLILALDLRSTVRRDAHYIEVHNLEFSLDLGIEKPRTETESDEGSSSENGADTTFGTVSVRPNISNKKDRMLVPGEILYAEDRNYFDVRSRPPKVQVEEHLYYQPCARCGRAWSDLSCQCHLIVSTT